MRYVCLASARIFRGNPSVSLRREHRRGRLPLYLKLQIGKCKLKIGNWKVQIANWKVQIEKCRLESADWKLQIGKCKL
ncbi:MAG: hypothetical protein COS94_05490, partial [Candidatus Hydrogenedentes bacterium CG07_land_8_20_14_0_80_42_17]